MPALAALVVCTLAQPGQPIPALAMVPPPGQTACIRQHAIPVKSVEAGGGFDDLEPLRKLIGEARIVALGEPTHGTREAFQMKHRLVEFLSQQMGFSVFSIEASMPEAFAVDDFVSGGRGDAQRLVGGMGFWTWNTQEVLDLVRWMRGNNEKGPHPVRFTGFDMQAPELAMRTALDLIDKVDQPYAATARGVYAALKTAGAEGDSFGVATGSFPIQAAAGKHLVYSGWIKTQDVTPGYAGLWWRADGKEERAGAFDNMMGRGPSGTTDWTRYQIELDIPADITNINFGVLMPGGGTAWFDDLRVELDGKEFSDPERFDLAFEGGALKGLAATGGPTSGYSVGIDATQAHGGRSSLRLAREARDQARQGAQGPPPAAAAKLAKDVLDHMESQRAAYAQATNDGETDWAIQNARVVAQCFRMNAGTGPRVRDECMAANVKWILDNSPPKTRIILWAHNGHIARQAGWMGSHLAKMFGKDYVAIGFATSAGRYSAWSGSGVTGFDLARAPAGSFEWNCEATGLPLFILPTRDASPEDRASAWLAAPMQIRSIGALPMEQQFTTQDLSIAYDAVVYLRDTTQARQLSR